MTWIRCSSLVVVALSLAVPAWADDNTETFTQSLEALRRKEYFLAGAGFSAVIKVDPTNALAWHNRGCAYHGTRDYEHAIADYTEAIRLNPSAAASYASRGSAYKRKGDYTKAIADYKAAVRLDPHNPTAFNNLASLWATCAQAEVRNGKMAVEYAMMACNLTHWKHWPYLDTLAAAYAELGDFEEAVKWEKKVMTFSECSQRDREVADLLLKRYERHKPCRIEVVDREARDGPGREEPAVRQASYKTDSEEKQEMP